MIYATGTRDERANIQESDGVASRDAIQKYALERRQRATVKRGGEGGAAGVGDLDVAEAELLELRQPSSRRRRRTCLRRRRHEGGEAVVAERVGT